MGGLGEARGGVADEVRGEPADGGGRPIVEDPGRGGRAEGGDGLGAARGDSTTAGLPRTVGPLEREVLEEEQERRRVLQEREDLCDALKGLDVNLSHYELVLVGGRFWRMTSLCERAKWKTAPRGDDPAAIARRLSVVMRCCGRGPMPRLPIRTMAEVEKSVGRRSVSA